MKRIASSTPGEHGRASLESGSVWAVAQATRGVGRGSRDVGVCSVECGSASGEWGGWCRCRIDLVANRDVLPSG